MLRPERNRSQTFKSSSCIKSFLQCLCYWYNLHYLMFFIPSDAWKILFFIQVYLCSEVFCQRHFLTLFEKKFFDRSRFFKSVFTLVTSQCEYERSKIKLFYALFVNFSQLMVFYSLSFCECTFSFINEIFWKNSQLLWKQDFIARYLFSKVNVKVKTKSQNIWYVIQMLQSL